VTTLPETNVTFSAAQIGDVALLTASGELDLYAAEPLRNALTPLVEGEPPALIVDLSGVGFIDSTALGVLVGAAKLLRSGGGAFVVVSSDPRIVRVLEITGLTLLFALRKTLAEALDEHGASNG
jgi:anti-sigma B factor antagonist